MSSDNFAKQKKKMLESGKKLLVSSADVKFGRRVPTTPDATAKSSTGDKPLSLFGAALSELNKATAAVASTTEKQVPGKKHLTVIQDQMRPLIEKNIIAATWLDDMGKPQKEMQDRHIFYNNETLLLQGNLKSHFEKKNIKKFFEQG